MGTSLCCPDEVGLPPGPGKVEWLTPKWTYHGKTKSLSNSAIAIVSFEAGDIVETTYCLPLELSDLSGTFLEPFCYLLRNGDSLFKVLPLGWGLLYDHSAGRANLAAEHRYAPPPQMPGSLNAGPCHWLDFRALRPICTGERLYVERSSKNWATRSASSVFDAAARVFTDQSFIVRPDKKSMQLTQDAPQKFQLKDERSAPVTIGASGMRPGVGAFAGRNIQKGTMVEVVPSLPLSTMWTDGTILRDYVIENDFLDLTGTGLLHLGFGSVFFSHYVWKHQSI